MRFSHRVSTKEYFHFKHVFFWLQKSPIFLFLWILTFFVHESVEMSQGLYTCSRHCVNVEDEIKEGSVAESAEEVVRSLKLHHQNRPGNDF